MANKKNSRENPSMRQKTHEGVDRMMDRVEYMKEKSNDEIAHFKEKAAMMREDVDGYIRENPEKSVLIAAGIGLAAGAILAAALMRRRN